MKHIRTILFFLWFFASAILHCDELNHFPDLSISKNNKIHGMLSMYYSKFLNIMNEPTLPASEGEIYRFLWLRTFHKPIMINLGINNKGVGEIMVKEIEGASGYPNSLGSVSKYTTVHVSSEEVTKFIAVTEKEFWVKTATIEEFNCLDGATWILEGVKNNNYHVQIVHCPRTADSVEIIGRYLLQLSGMKVKNIY